jgi:hypothetical protein
MTSAWAMKKKSNGTYRARINARGFEQVDGEHYDIDTKSSPVTSLVTTRIVMTLIVMTSWAAHLMDVHGAFLKGKFRDGEIIYMKVPQGFKKFYPKNVALLLLRTIYGLVQAALAFWRETVAAFGYMNYIRSKADPCLHFKWTVRGLIIWISWIDEFLVCGNKQSVMEAKDMMGKIFDCEDVGEMNMYVGCKIERDLEAPSLRTTQPACPTTELRGRIRSFADGQACGLPAPTGSMLTKGDKTDSEAVPLAQQAYRKGVGKLLHVTRWTRPDIMNSERELSRFSGGALMAHMKAMYRCMANCVATSKRGINISPNTRWDGSPEFKFVISGRADSDYAKDLETRRSVSGIITFFLCEAVITMRSKMMPMVALSVTDAELFAAVMTAQDILFIMRIIESMGLLVELPMLLEVDNKGAKDLVNNRSVGGLLRHVEVK